MGVNIYTNFIVIDNSGIKKLYGIKSLYSNKTKVKVGDLIIGVSKLTLTTSRFKESTLFKALIIRTKISVKYKNNSKLKFNDNAVCLLNKQNTFLGTKLNGFCPYFLKFKYPKLSLLSPTFI